MRPRSLAFGVLMPVLCLSLVAAAEETKKPKAPEPPKERLVETHHTVPIGGQPLAYTAAAGTLVIEKEDGTPRASLFFVAYTKDDVEERRRRPVTFSFNGGPGAAAVWLHLGALGPRRVRLRAHGLPPPPPYELVDNEHSLLGVTDLVFVDPVSTGYSRAAPGQDPKQFHGVEGDIESVGEFIRLYTTRFGRWGSPKFLAGESYGTVRAAGLAGHLQDRHGMYLNGVILVSMVLNFQTIRFAPGNELPYALFLPSYTATAWYHKKLPPPLQDDLGQALAQAEAFALEDYAVALLKGTRLTDAQRTRLAEQLARLTGLPAETLRRSNLRVPIFRFTKELLRDRRRTVGRFDSRFLGTDKDAAGAAPEYDPSFADIQGAFATTLNHTVRTELEFETDLPYETLAGHRVQPWSYDSFKNRYLDVTDTLRLAMTKNPHLQVFVAAGLYDLATPALAARYTLDHLELPPSRRENLTFRRYEAGHMMYADAAVLPRFAADLARFIRSAAAPQKRERNEDAPGGD